MSVLSDGPVPATRRGTVLIVDDDEGVRLSRRAILEERCEVPAAPDGARALEILRGRDVDVVTLTSTCPAGGADVLAHIKALDASIVVARALEKRALDPGRAADPTPDQPVTTFLYLDEGNGRGMVTRNQIKATD